MQEVPSNDKGMIALLKGADALFLPVDFTAQSIERMRYSYFAKLPAYIMSGTPVLVWGPVGIAAIDFAIQEGWAHVVTENDPLKIKNELVRLIEDEGFCKSLSLRARECALKYFDIKKIRNDFQRALAGMDEIKP